MHCTSINRPYGHRLRELAYHAGDPGVARRLGVPRVTARSWMRRGAPVYARHGHVPGTSPHVGPDPRAPRAAPRASVCLGRHLVEAHSRTRPAQTKNPGPPGKPKARRPLDVISGSLAGGLARASFASTGRLPQGGESTASGDARGEEDAAHGCGTKAVGNAGQQSLRLRRACAGTERSWPRSTTAASSEGRADRRPWPRSRPSW